MIDSYEKFYEVYPNLVFIKTKIKINSPEQFTEENFIIEEDTPSLIPGQSILIPLYEGDYPNVFKEATAMLAGMWAANICNEQKWEVNYGYVNEILKHLENDYTKGN